MEGTARGYGLIIAATALLQFVLVSIAFPVTELFTQNPLFHIDGAYHWYEMKVAAGLASQGRLVGYDPLFAAGHIGGVPYNISAKLPAALGILVSPWLSSIVAYKLFVFVSAVIGPAAVPLAARELQLPRLEGVVSALLAVLLWWVSPFRWYHTAGMVAFVLCAYAALPYAAACLRHATSPRGTPLPISLLVAGAVLFFCHPVFPICVAFVLLPLLVAHWPDVRARALWVELGLVAAGCLLLNLPWIIGTFRYPGIADPIPFQKVVDVRMVWQDMLGLWGGSGRGSKLYLLLAVLATVGCVTAKKGSARRLSVAFGLSGVALILFADLGAALRPVAILQPNRFEMVGYLTLIIPASLGVTAVLHGVWNFVGWRRAVAAVSSTVIALGILVFMNEVRKEIQPGSHGHYGAPPPEVRPLGEQTRWALAMLAETRPDERVLFETSLARVHDDAHIAGFLTATSHREFIGGPYPYVHFAGFWDGQVFGKAIEGLTADQFGDYLKLYNVGAIIVHSDAAKTALQKMPGIALVAEHAPLAFYRVKEPGGFFVTGSGEVAHAALNSLTLTHIIGETVVLKYHYVPGMRTEPATPIEGQRLLDDPQPFIKLAHPPSELTITLP